jgi:diphthamide synthase subunit DPH2
VSDKGKGRREEANVNACAVRVLHNHTYYVQVGRMELTFHGLHVAHYPEAEIDNSIW